MNQQVELLAPAGSYNALLIAIKAGANAIYLAGKRFGARSYAPNFTNEELEKAVIYAHLRNVLIYVTINTIIFPSEWEDLKQYIDYLYQIQVDALIVQDLGVINYVRTTYPDFCLHASTQMNIYNEIGVQQLINLGVSRVILARETPLEVIKSITKLPIEVEVFIHGALCYCYSGNCLMSYVIGDRSGNRGSCAQPCRRKYSLIEDDKLIVEKKALLSMKDLMTINNINELIDAGIKSLKIEGRMKGLEYNNIIVGNYRQAIDSFYKHQVYKLNPINEKHIKVTFNRGFTKGYLFNSLNNQLTTINYVNHQGILIGKVIKCNPKEITISLLEPVYPKDGLRVMGKEELGIVINKESKKEINIRINNQCSINDLVYKTTDGRLIDETNQLLKKETPIIPIKMSIYALIDKPLKLVINCNKEQVVVEGRIVEYKEENILSLTIIKEQLSKLGNTPYYVQTFKNYIDNNAFFTLKDLNDLRRLMVNKLDEIRVKAKRVHIEQTNLPLSDYIKTNNEVEVLVHNIKQKEVAERLGIKTIYCDFIDKNNYFYENRGIGLSNNISDKVMIHSLNQLHENNLITSPYFNIVNQSSIELITKLGIHKTYLSYELSYEECKKMNLSKSLIDLGFIAYGRIDLMITKQCLIASSLGFDHLHCGACLKHQYKIKDEYGNIMPLLTNKDCQVRIISYKVINRINEIKKYNDLGINKSLLIFTIESPKEVETIIKETLLLNK